MNKLAMWPVLIWFLPIPESFLYVTYLTIETNTILHIAVKVLGCKKIFDLQKLSTKNCCWKGFFVSLHSKIFKCFLENFYPSVKFIKAISLIHLVRMSLLKQVFYYVWDVNYKLKKLQSCFVANLSQKRKNTLVHYV